jgi:hypothetical protein
MRSRLMIRAALFLPISLLSSSPLWAGGIVTINSVDFAADKTTVGVGEVVTFSDLSSVFNDCGPASITFDWSFGSGATPPTASETQSLTSSGASQTDLGSDQLVSYGTPGLKDVSLKVSISGSGCGSPSTTTTKLAYVDVISPVPTLSGWGAVLLSLFMLDLGLGGLLQPRLRLAGAGEDGIALPGARWRLPYAERYLVPAVALTLALMALGFGASAWLTGSIRGSDLIGGLLAAPLFAYFVSLVLALRRR